ncbi:hypothetical protein [Acidiphilium multivorum]|uniref:hypothetical protein n=1 Tax=Acidiphilium multivorum TaxID=62140 RepID=UPI001F4C47B8|nr:hypothetical protein [Acidiphilium multivorum]
MIGLHCRTTPNGRQTVILLEEAGLDFRIEPRARHWHSLDDFPNLKRRFTAIAARRACDLAADDQQHADRIRDTRAHSFGPRARRP